MYKQVVTDKEYTLNNGATCHPIATLADEYDGRVQIDIDGDCYVLRLKNAYDDKYKTIPHIFPEAFDVLITLAPPNFERNIRRNAIPKG